MADLTIKIDGDVSSFEDALDKAQRQTEHLSEGLTKIAEVAAVGFAALTAEVFESVKSFAESEQAGKSLNLALQNQGIYSKELAENYKAQAKELSELTGVDDDAIVKSQALMQSLIGQQKITPELTKAILDLSAGKKMDLDTTTSLISKGIEGHVAALGKLGIVIDAHLNKEERTAEIIKQVTIKFGGMAEAANQGLGSYHGLRLALADLQKAIGERFAPAVTAGMEGLTKFFRYMGDSPELVEFIAAAIAGGIAVTGIVGALALGSIAFLKFKAAVVAAGVAEEAMGLATKGLVAATGIGLLVVAVVEIYEHWGALWPRIQAVFQTAVDNISKLGGGLADIMRGMWHFDVDAVKAGLEKAKEALTGGLTEYNTIVKQKVDQQAAIVAAGEEKQNAAKAQAAAENAAREKYTEDAKQALLKASNEAALLEVEQASDALQKLKKQEIDILTKLEDEKYKELRTQLKAHLLIVQGLESDQAKQDAGERQGQFDQELAQSATYRKMDEAHRKAFLEKEGQDLKASIQTKESTETLAAKKELQISTDSHNLLLADEQKYGTAYALINQAMHSAIYTGTKTAFGDMADLQNSNNSTLKAAGKVAAIANVTIKTAESAMNIFAGFSTIPIIGPELGLIAAGLAVMYGAEQIGSITGAAQGGLLTGGIRGVDSIPVLAQRGELISPVQNFDEVIGSVRAGREAEKYGGGIGGGSGSVEVTLNLKDNLMDFVEAKLVQRSNLGISVRGKKG